MKRVVAIFFMVMVAVCVMASKASCVPHTVRLADGRMVECYIMGGCDMYYLMTADGRYIVQEGDEYRLATAKEREELDRRIASYREEVEKREKERDEGRVLKPKGVTRTGEPDVEIPQNDRYGHKYGKRLGSPRIAVLLVDFADRQMTYGAEDFRKVFSAEGYADMETYRKGGVNYGSVCQYFKDCSNGKFTPDFEVYGVYHINEPATNYISSKAKSYVSLMDKACQLADGDVNFVMYDQVCVIAAGYAYQNTANLDNVVVKTVYSTGTAPLFRADGKPFYRCFVGAELNGAPDLTNALKTPEIASIGMICHELGHTIGLPDIYPNVSWTTGGYANETYDDRSMEYWDVMDAGFQLDGGHCPMPLTAMERWMLGWTEAPGRVTEGEHKLAVWMANADDAAVTTALRVENPADETEFWVLENIPSYTDGMPERMGWYMGNAKKGQPMGHGMTVTHIRYSEAFNVTCGYINNGTVPEWTLMPADGHLYSTYRIKNEGAVGSLAYDRLYMPEWAVVADCVTDAYPLMAGTTRWDKENIGYVDGGAAALVRKDGVVGGVTYRYGYPETAVEAVDYIRNWNEHTATDGLRTIERIEQKGGNGAPVTFVYGTEAAIKSVEETGTAAARQGVYDLQGRRLGADACGLAAGIYIVNGTKVMIR